MPTMVAPAWRRVVLATFAAVALVVGTGIITELITFGRTDEVALRRVEKEVRAEFDAMAAALRATAASLASRDDLIRRMATDPEAARELFDLARDAVVVQAPSQVAVTVHDHLGVPRAWSGRPPEVPRERVTGPGALFIAPGPPGLRLVHIEPVFEGGPAAEPLRRVGTIVAERVFAPVRGVGDPTSEESLLTTSTTTVAVRTRYEGAGVDLPPAAFLIQDPNGEPLLEVRVSPGDLGRARHEWRQRVGGFALSAVGLGLLLLIGPLFTVLEHARTIAVYIRALLSAVALLVAGRILFWLAAPSHWTGPPLFSPATYASTSFEPLLRSPADFLLTGLTLVGLVALAGHAVQRLRPASRGWRRCARATPASAGAFMLLHVVAGAAVAGVLLGQQAFLSETIDNTSIDILLFSLHPWEPSRLALLFGLLFFQAAGLWLCVLILLGALAPWRVPRRDPLHAVWLLLAWTAPAALLPPLVNVTIATEAVPAGIVLLAVAGCAGAAYRWRPLVARFRHASLALRVIAFFLALLVPAVLLYPSVLHHADRAKRRLIETQYALQTANYPQELQTRLYASLDEIDAIPYLAELVSDVPAKDPPQIDVAFRIWRETRLAQFRLTSAIEVYGGDGRLASRFALNFPEYAPIDQIGQIAECDWDVFGEAAPFGSQERRMLHAERGICSNGQLVGGIVVHVMLDYRTLPFISSQNPYFEVFRPGPPALHESMPGRDIEVAIYGWGRLPIFTSGRQAWPLEEDVFARVYASREPFWTRIHRGPSEYHVHLSNDRAGIYAVGYPVLGAFDHLVHLAEISTLAGLAFVALLAGAALARAVWARQPAGRGLLREIRASFYRKLFLAFVAASIIPVITLALVVRTYFETILLREVEAEAARTAVMAQRVIEEAAALQQIGEPTPSPLSDEMLIWISQIIDQAVNIFDGAHLLATSERDLFSSGLLPTRTPHDVYRAIVLQRLPTFVGDDALGEFEYMVAAAPVRADGRDAIVTVPLALRQAEIEREIDELDRGVYLAALIFILLGAGIGLAMAERIADPVKRLTRATQRVATGDFDARVMVKSADELQRLVEAFNSMAAELKAQRAQLERTHRLEAWAEMARQVAHEIKNPLTPIQLSAEHLRRVHADRGLPLGPVLDGCVDSILNQVRLLRQIASEFSSFASTPTARPALTEVADLVEEVVEPYRLGLRGRITLTVDVPRTLPPVRVDRTLIARALSNVIENALHAMPGAGSLGIAAGSQDGAVRISLSDTGVGMDEEALARAFEPYFSTKATGTGLGLSIAKRNVELNGGRLAVVSQRGVGTTVTITLPIPGAGAPR
jgi:signal transduction histidine kinase